MVVGEHGEDVLDGVEWVVDLARGESKKSSGAGDLPRQTKN
jgi:hypothetical protein